DDLVTGVQTCALPICLGECRVGPQHPAVQLGERDAAGRAGEQLLELRAGDDLLLPRLLLDLQQCAAEGLLLLLDVLAQHLAVARSEERRVGKESRTQA